MRAQPLRFALRTLALLAPLLISPGADAADVSRFTLNGTALLAADAPVPADDRWRLNARLVATTSAAVEPMPLANERFALTAMLSATTVACASDTIFRDAFDGSGL
jgi:hypothetical protein